MNNKPSKKTWIVPLVIIALGLVVYFYYAGGSSSSSSSLTSTPQNTEASAASAQVLDLLNKIKSLKIDSTLFSNTAYKTLRDYSVTIPQENVGRSNPFAPIGGEAVQTQTTIKAKR